jgi:hypothetical protein
VASQKNGMHTSSLSLVATEFSFISVPAASLSEVNIINLNMVPFLLFQVHSPIPAVQSVIFLK